MAPKRKAPAAAPVVAKPSKAAIAAMSKPSASTSKSTRPVRSGKKSKVVEPDSPSEEEEDEAEEEEEELVEVKKKEQSVVKPKAKPKAKEVKKVASAKKVTSKKQEEVVFVSSSSDDEEEEVDQLEIVEPVKKKAKPTPAPKKKVVEKKVVPKKSSVAAAPVVAAADSQAKASAAKAIGRSNGNAASTSNTEVAARPVKALPSPKKGKAVAPPKILTYAEASAAWLDTFVDDTASDETMLDGDGIEKLFESMEVSMETVTPFLLAYVLEAKPGTFGSFVRDDFKTALEPHKISSSAALAEMLTQLERDLYSKKGIATLVVPTIAPAAIPHFSPYGDYSDDEDYYRYGGARPAPVVPVKKAMNFIDFYRFIFGFVKPEGQKSLEGAMAIALWGLVLTPKYALAKSFVEYVTTLGSGFKGVSADVWSQLLDFVSTVKEDLTGFSEDDAWPSTIDAFVEWKREQLAATA